MFRASSALTVSRRARLLLLHMRTPMRMPLHMRRWVLPGAVGFLGVAVLVPFARGLFHFAPLHPTDLLLSLGAGLLCVLWFEVLKRLRRARDGTRLAPGA